MSCDTALPFVCDCPTSSNVCPCDNLVVSNCDEENRISVTCCPDLPVITSVVSCLNIDSSIIDDGITVQDLDVGVQMQRLVISLLCLFHIHFIHNRCMGWRFGSIFRTWCR